MRRGGEASVTAAQLAFLAAFSPSALLAQNTASQHIDNGTRRMMKSADAIFAMNAAQSGLAEVQLGQLAAQKASNPDLKAFGQQMFDDHRKANDKLKSIAQAENMTLPNSLNARDQAEYTKLQTLSGVDFDRAYVRDMVKDHEQDVKQLQKEASSGKDPQMKRLASETLPTVEEHLSKIRGIQAEFR
jgi:putative membrane protein